MTHQQDTKPVLSKRPGANLPGWREAGSWLDRLAGLVAGKRLKPVLWLKTLIGKDAALGAAHSVREPVNHS